MADNRLDKTSAAYDGRGRNARGLLGQIIDGDAKVWYFQFNPSQIQMGESANWTVYNTHGSLQPLATFQHMRPDDITFELLLDATDKTQRDVSINDGGDYVGAYADLLALLTILNPNIANEEFDTSRRSRFTAPAFTILGMGPIIKRCVFTQASWKIVQWFNDLIPSRILVNITLKPVTVSLESDFLLVQRMAQTAHQNKMFDLGNASSVWAPIHAAGKPFTSASRDSSSLFLLE